MVNVSAPYPQFQLRMDQFETVAQVGQEIFF